MTREEIIEKLRAMEPELRARGITRLQMFGSRARGDNREDSDLDLLIEVDSKAKFSLIDLAGVHVDLTEQLGVETYATIDGDEVPSKFRSRISDDLIQIFEAA
ncbi:MAG TPA: nucleotidyltransferase domain-containing protein [Rhizobiaceae bacterium]|nr:nucleotidyltransferase domain-containing protein [Rhizobiaceae bacterium]